MRGWELCAIAKRTNFVAGRPCRDRQRRPRERWDGTRAATGGRPPIFVDRSGLARRSRARCAAPACTGASHTTSAVRGPGERGALGHRSRAHPGCGASARLEAPVRAASLRRRRASPGGELRALFPSRCAYAEGRGSRLSQRGAAAGGVNACRCRGAVGPRQRSRITAVVIRPITSAMTAISADAPRCCRRHGWSDRGGSWHRLTPTHEVER